MKLKAKIASSKEVVCDGGAAEYGASLGHPKVYLNMGSKDKIACNYCGQTFELDPNASGAAAH